MRRILSAAVLIALVGLVIWRMPAWSTAVLAVVASALASVELVALSRAPGVLPAAFAGLASAAMALAIAQLPVLPGPVPIDALLVAIMIGAGIVTLAAGAPVPVRLTLAATLVMAPLYVGLPLGTLVWTREVFGPAAITWLIATIAISDSAQYYTGRTLGRTKLAPVISPAKTVEGALGGLLAAAIAGAALGPWAMPGWSPALGAATALLLAVVGIMGDLFESLLKRSAGVKDSSNLIPGHGGVLDRIDSYLFAAPVFYLLAAFRL